MLSIQFCNANSSSLPLIFAKCMNDFILIFYVSFSTWALWSGIQSSLLKVKDRKLKNCTKYRHLIYSYTPTIIIDIPVPWKFKGNVFFNILGIILLDSKSRLFPPLLTIEIWEKNYPKTKIGVVSSFNLISVLLENAQLYSLLYTKTTLIGNLFWKPIYCEHFPL